MLLMDIPSAVGSTIGRTAERLGATPRPLSRAQEEAARRAEECHAVGHRLTGVSVGPDIGLLPPDIALFTPGMRMGNAFYSAVARHNTEARRPGARIDDRGRLIDVRTATEEVIAALGPLAKETGERRRVKKVLGEDKLIATEKQNFLRAILDGDNAQLVTSLKRIAKVAPGFFLNFDEDTVRRGLTDEATKRLFDRETQVFRGLSQGMALKRTTEAIEKVTSPKWRSQASINDQRREAIILTLGMQRFNDRLPSLLPK